MKNRIRIGAGAAWWGDRIEPARLNAEQGDLDYLCFETMAEATVSAAQVRARGDPSFPGYDTYLDDRMRAVLPGCLKRGTKIISNQGWINPEGAAQRIVHWLRELGARGIKVAAISGGLITDRALELTDKILENGKPTYPVTEINLSGNLKDMLASIEAVGNDLLWRGSSAAPSLRMAKLTVSGL